MCLAMHYVYLHKNHNIYLSMPGVRNRMGKKKGGYNWKAREQHGGILDNGELVKLQECWYLERDLGSKYICPILFSDPGDATTLS